MATFHEDIVSGGRGFGGIGGGDGLGLIALLALLGRGGFGGLGNNGCADGGVSPAAAAFDSTILNSLAGIGASIPTNALETQANINNGLASLALGTQQGFANVKDSVQASAALNLSATNQVNTAVLTTGLQTQIAIGNDGDKTRALIQSINDANLQRELTVAQSALMEERTTGRIRDVEVSVNQSVSQNNAQMQAQAQQQQQFQVLANIAAGLNNLAGDIQAVKQGQVIFNSGAMVGSGTQSAANTKVA